MIAASVAAALQAAAGGGLGAACATPSLRAALCAALPRVSAAAAASASRRAFGNSASKPDGGSGPNGKHSAVYLTDANGTTAQEHTPLILGLLNYFERHLPYVGYFTPFGGSPGAKGELPVDRHLRLVQSVFGGDLNTMSGLPEDEAARLIAAGKTNELLDRAFNAYANIKDTKDMVLVSSPPMVGEQLDAAIAEALGAPVVLAIDGSELTSPAEAFRLASLRRQLYKEARVPFLGAVVNRVPARDHAMAALRLRRRFEEGGVPLLGVLPESPVLRAVRLDEVKEALGAEVLFSSAGEGGALDEEYSYVLPAAQRLADVLDILRNDGAMRPLVVTTVDRLDLVLGLMGAQVSAHGPGLAGVLLCPSGHRHSTAGRARDLAQDYFDGIRRSGLYKGFIFPVLAVDRPLVDVLRALDGMRGAILPTSARKISECKMLFDAGVDTNALVTGIEASESLEAGRVTPKMFQHRIKTTCAREPQTIVLPEATDARILLAAAEVTQRGLARVVLLGDPVTVTNEAKKAGADISRCAVVDPQNCPRFDAYVDALVEARRKKGISREAAADQVRGDVNTFGVMMVATGDADGMVSGAAHTTAATVRPAMQVLKARGLVSSVFFMCLPDKVLVYGDCAVNVSPSSADLAAIAATSAATAAAFGLEPRVAMLSYSTLGSGAGPDVQKVADAVKIVKDLQPDLMVEGPIQYDAAIDPAVAKVKVKGASDVAGRANVFVFPDLNTGNNTYKAVQQATGAVAMGPVMQGLSKPVNDLSRGCTVADVVNTICVTSVQALGAKTAAKAAAGAAAGGGAAAAGAGAKEPAAAAATAAAAAA